MRKFVPWIVFSALAASCAPEVVRVPAICTNAPYCVSPENNGDPLVSPDPDRFRAFLKRNAESTVFVRSATYDEKGGLRYRSAAGAVIGVKGLVLTSYSRVRASEFVTVSYRRMADDGTVSTWREVPAEIETFDRERDIAVLHVKDLALMPAPFPLRRGPVVKGDADWFFGSRVMWQRVRITDADVSFGSHAHGFIATDARPSAEDAGSPIVDDCGELVGILLFDDGKRAYGLSTDEAFKALDLKMQDLY